LKLATVKLVFPMFDSLQIRRRVFPITVTLAVLLLALPITAAGQTASLDAGFRQMYNLDFGGAHRTFEAWEQQHPEDPLGPISNAAAYLFSEFDRLHILEVELFTNDEALKSREKVSADSAVRNAFDSEVQKGDRLASDLLSRSPTNQDALFSKALENGLRGDYLALIEKRNLAGLSSMKAGRRVAEKLISIDPSYYDAYLAIGIENYLLGINPAPIRWMLKLGGAQTDKDHGLKELRITADKGRFLAPYARLLLAVAAIRDQDRTTARTLLAGLSREFPQNQLYQKELAKLQP
jgi:hypothetical protein